MKEWKLFLPRLTRYLGLVTRDRHEWTLTLSWSALILSAACAGLLGTLSAQRPPREESYFYTEGKRHSLDIPLNQIGIVASDGLSREEILAFAQTFRLKFVRYYTDDIYIFYLPEVMERKEIRQLAREISRRGEKVVRYVGFLATPHGAEAPFVVTDEFIAQFKPQLSREEIERYNKENGVQVVAPDRFVKSQYLLRVTEASPLDALDMANLYEESGLTVFAHPNFVRVVVYRQFIPNDALFGNQWHHQNTGQGGGTVDADVDTPLAWDITQGVGGTVIAVIDNGFDIAHEDLLPNLWVNSGETAGNNTDDDGNGFVDDINGWDFSGNDGNPSPGATQDHGTAVAGVAAARSDNTLGVSGACGNCRLMLIRRGTTVQADANAFGYAQQMGAAIITNSWGYAIGSPTTTNVVNAINAAATNGRGGLGAVVLFAMNNGNVNDCTGASPDISSLASVVAVSASSNQDRKVTESAFGNCMEVLAPTHRGYGPNLSGFPAGSGVAYTGTLNIATTDRTGSTGYNNARPSNTATGFDPMYCPAETPNQNYTLCFGGTSSATPLTAGIVGLALSANAVLTRLQVQQLLQDTTDRIEDSAGAYAEATGFSSPVSGTASHGWGRVNAFEAVRVVAPLAQAGRGGVDVFVRDNRLDWGNSEQPSNVLFEPARGFIPHYASVDIKVDAPPFQATPVTSSNFDALLHESPKTGQLNRAYVRVRNRGPNTANTVSVKLHWADAGPGLPALPGDFWSAWPNDPSSTAVWHTMPCTANPASTVCTVTNLAYSGASVAGCPGRAQPACPGGNDAAQIVVFDFQGPAIGPSGVNHFCLFAVLDSPQDRAGPLSRVPTAADFIPDMVTPVDNNVTHRNIQVDDSGRSTGFEERLHVRNPFDRTVRAQLRLQVPKGWVVSLDRFRVDELFVLQPKEDVLVKMTVQTPTPGVTGVVSLQQETWLEKQMIVGGVEYLFRPEVLAPPRTTHSASLNGVSLVGDPQTGSIVNYLSDGSSYGAKPGDTFSFAPLQLPDGAEIQRIKCVILDDASQGYIQITLNRGPINTGDSTVPPQMIASAVTFPAAASPNFVEISGNADPSRAVVNNASYGYFFRVDFLDNPGTSGEPSLRFRGCSVEYVK